MSWGNELWVVQWSMIFVTAKDLVWWHELAQFGPFFLVIGGPSHKNTHTLHTGTWVLWATHHFHCLSLYTTIVPFKDMLNSTVCLYVTWFHRGSRWHVEILRTRATADASLTKYKAEATSLQQFLNTCWYKKHDMKNSTHRPSRIYYIFNNITLSLSWEQDEERDEARQFFALNYDVSTIL